jgi:hypothetical protein
MNFEYKKIIVIAITLLIFSSASAIFQTGWHDAGLLYLKTSNYGMFGFQNCGIWPKGTNENYIFGAGIWICALKPGPHITGLISNIDSLVTSIPVTSITGFDSTRGIIQIDNEYIYYRQTTPTSFDSCIRGFAKTQRASHLSGSQVHEKIALQSCGYDPSLATSEFAPGDLPNEPGYTDTLDHIYFSDNPRDTAEWPRHDPQGHKIIISNKDSYSVFNDLDSSRHTVPGKPLGIKIIQIGYSWYYHYYEDFIFFTYNIINTSNTDTLTDIYSGCCCDADIGDATDDLAGLDAAKNLGYAWDSNFSEPGWIHTPGYIGFDFLESPHGPSGQLGLTAFKILHNPGYSGPGVPDPANDLEAFLTVAGYDHPTGIYHPVDSISVPTDIRFVQCTGPFKLPPQETARVVIAVIYGADTNDLQANDDLAQNLYDIGFVTHRATVLTPNGGATISGTYNCTWSDSSATGDPLYADLACSRNRGQTWLPIINHIGPNVHNYLWNTTTVPDGARYKFRVTVYGGPAVGEAVSNNYFTINNPGNGVPDLLLYSINQNLRDTATIFWDAVDPDGDSLSIDLYLRRVGSTWFPLATGLQNIGQYRWNTRITDNGDYYVMIKASDQDTFSIDTTQYLVIVTNDHNQAAIVYHTSGGCNSLSISALSYNPQAYAGHSYQISFKPIIEQATQTEPIYRYSLKDLTTNTTLLDSQPLSAIPDGQIYVDYSPVIDGFALQFNTQIDRNTFRFTDFYILVNRSGFLDTLEIYGTDSTGIAPPLIGLYWPFRGSDYQIRWKRDSIFPDSLTLAVYDMTNGVYIPFDRNRGHNWHFGLLPRTGKYFNPALHRGFYLCGGYFWFNRVGPYTVLPATGDVWMIHSSGNKVPCDGNIYTFSTPTGIAEEFKSPLGFFKISPNPFTRNTRISYAMTEKGKVRIELYNTLGQMKAEFLNEIKEPGNYQFNWNGTGANGSLLSNGIYFLRFKGDKFDVIKKTILLR